MALEEKSGSLKLFGLFLCELWQILHHSILCMLKYFLVLLKNDLLVALTKDQGITKVNRIHPVGNMNVFWQFFQTSISPRSRVVHHRLTLTSLESLCWCSYKASTLPSWHNVVQLVFLWALKHGTDICALWLHLYLPNNRTELILHLPAQHEFRVLAVDVVIHQFEQQCSHNVSVVFQFSMQSHCQQGGKIHLGPGVKVMTALQGTDKLQTHHHTQTHTKINRQMTSEINEEAHTHRSESNIICF